MSLAVVLCNVGQKLFVLRMHGDDIRDAEEMPSQHISLLPLIVGYVDGSCFSGGAVLSHCDMERKTMLMDLVAHPLDPGVAGGADLDTAAATGVGTDVDRASCCVQMMFEKDDKQLS
jgi:hypothetical protein